MWRLDRRQGEHESRVAPGVFFTVRPPTVEMRQMLAEQVGALRRGLRCAAAAGTPDGDLTVAELQARIWRIYLVLGLEQIRGLRAEGVEVDWRTLIEDAPEELVREIVEAIQDSLRVTELERKNLILTFHFLRKNPEGWDCGACRAMRLEERRRCALLGYEAQPGRIVWGHGDVVSEQCPRSVMTGLSEAWVERWPMWRESGRQGTAKDLEAMVLLEREWEKVQHGERTE